MDSGILPEPLLQSQLPPSMGRRFSTVLHHCRFPALRQKPETFNGFCLSRDGMQLQASAPIIKAILAGPLHRLTIQDRYVAATDSNHVMDRGDRRESGSRLAGKVF